MEDVLSQIFSNLTSYISAYKVLSEGEIRQAIWSEIGQLDENGKIEIEKQLGGEPEEALFQSIVGSPLSIFSPSLVRRDYLGETFYAPHVHRSFIKEMEQAFGRLTRARAPMILPRLEAVISLFLKKAGYTSFTIVDRDEPMDSKELTATKDNSNLHLLLLPTIAFAHQYPDRTQIVVVPTEKTPLLFLRFFKERHLEGTDVQVWVVDPEKGTVSPFFGNCSDKEIVKNFANPDLKEGAADHFQTMKLPTLHRG
jgi:hypothetical protein